MTTPKGKWTFSSAAQIFTASGTNWESVGKGEVCPVHIWTPESGCPTLTATHEGNYIAQMNIDSTFSITREEPNPLFRRITSGNNVYAFQFRTAQLASLFIDALVEHKKTQQAERTPPPARDLPATLSIVPSSSSSSSIGPPPSRPTRSPPPVVRRHQTPKLPDSPSVQRSTSSTAGNKPRSFEAPSRSNSKDGLVVPSRRRRRRLSFNAGSNAIPPGLVSARSKTGAPPVRPATLSRAPTAPSSAPPGAIPSPLVIGGGSDKPVRTSSLSLAGGMSFPDFSDPVANAPTIAAPTPTRENTSPVVNKTSRPLPTKPKPSSLLNTAASSSSTSTASSLGSSRGSKVDDTDYGDVKRRESIAKEMLDVQRGYLDVLRGLDEKLRRPLEQKNILPADQMESMFKGFSSLLVLHTDMLSQFEKRVAEWKDDSTTADLWLNFRPYAGTYYKQYVAAYEASNSSDLLTKLLKNNSKFRKLVQQYKKSANIHEKQSIQQHLIKPVQLPPRMMLLIRDMYKSTSRKHPHFAQIHEALGQYQALATEINEAVQSDTNKRTFEELGKSGIGFGDLVSPQRSLIDFRPVTMVGGSESELMNLGLCSDCLFISTTHFKGKSGGFQTLSKHNKPREKLLKRFPLLQVWTADFSDQGTIDRFSIITPEESFIIRPKGAREQVRQWLGTIEAAIEAHFRKQYADSIPQCINHEDSEHRRFKYTFKNGDLYQGWWRYGKPDGDGVFSHANGNAYTGKFVLGKHEGVGQLTYHDGSVYKGEWLKGHHHGQGKLTAASGDVYEGEWKEGLKHGKGTLHWKNGDLYEGQFAENKMCGQGKLVFSGESMVYEGSFLLNHFQGKGKLVWAGNTYEGEFQGGFRQGKGKLTYANGDVYSGSFVKNTPMGQGKLIKHHNFYEYEGTWINGVISGVGKIRVRDAYVYEGNVEAGQRHGEGECTYQDGSVYKGSWDHDVYHGKGQLENESNKTYYSGDWERGLRHGEGEALCADGSKYIGKFVNDQFGGEGNLTTPTGYVYKGQFVNGRFQGHGKLMSADGNYVYDGEWKEGFKDGQGTEIDRTFGTFNGIFKQDSKHGNGTFTAANKSFTYTGQWSKGLRTSELGVLTKADQSTVPFKYIQRNRRASPSIDELPADMPDPISLPK